MSSRTHPSEEIQICLSCTLLSCDPDSPKCPLKATPKQMAKRAYQRKNQARYAARHPEKIKEMRRSYYERHKRKEKAQSARWHRDHREYCREKAREYYHAHKNQRAGMVSAADNQAPKSRRQGANDEPDE